MATFDQLPAEQRAIIELVVQRGRSYDDLADMLDLPPSRVRELAREALSELSPVSAGRVDPDWREQVADYLLGQQTGPESRATQGHLRRSEPARTWALSVLDSLDTLYENGAVPEIPAAETRERGRAREREPARRERERERVRERDRGRERERPARTTAALSQEGRTALLRRRAIGAAIAVLAVALLVWLIFLRGDDDDGGGGEDRAAQTDTAADADAAATQVIGQVELTPVGGASASGFAFVGVSGNNPVLLIRGKVPPVGETEAYQVWLYNSRTDARSIGAQRPDEQGNFGGRGPVPQNLERFQFIDISRESLEDGDDGHSGRSVLRGRIRDLEPVSPGNAPPGTQPGVPGGQGGQQPPPQPQPQP
jgi:hypothetical protein